MSRSAVPAALVTGGARRVGRAIALELARAGHDVFVHYHASADAAAETCGAIRALGRQAWAVPGDLADAAVPPGVVERIRAEAGRLDVLVNNAALFAPMTLAEFDPTAWHRTLQVNLAAPLQLCAAAVRLMTAGAIINLTDTTVARPPKRFLAYGPSKAGLEYATRALAASLAPDIRVNAVAPGIAAFPDDYPPALRDQLIAQVPMGRAGTPEDVARAVRFLVASPYITGQVLVVDGGWR